MTALTFEVTRGRLGAAVSAPGLGDASAELPEGAYTTLRTYHGDRVVRLADHVERLRLSARDHDPGTTHPLEEEEVRQGIAAALRAAGHPESRFRLTFAPPRLFVTVEPFEPLADVLYARGVWCVTVPVVRASPHAKDTRFLPAAHEAYRALPAGVHEGLLVSEDGAILEGLSSNFFAVRAGRLYTEESRALFGVTRSLVLEAARGHLDPAGRGLYWSELADAGEAFLTSTSRGILPVVRVDETDIGDGQPGPITGDLRRRFDTLVEREALPIIARG